MLELASTRIDVVDVFRKSEEVPPIAKDAIDVRAGALWMQLGIENQVAADLARAALVPTDGDGSSCLQLKRKSVSPLGLSECYWPPEAMILGNPSGGIKLSLLRSWGDASGPSVGM